MEFTIILAYLILNPSFSLSFSSSSLTRPLCSKRVAFQQLRAAEHDNYDESRGTSNNRQQQNRRQQNLTSAQRERRAEDQRRLSRQSSGFATPGQSSAIPGASDFTLDVAATERQYLTYLSNAGNNVEKQVSILTEEGLNHIRMLRLSEASAMFKQVYLIKPDAYLWQDGLVKYYLGDYHGAAESLARNALRYEKRFGEPASEERIWRDACEMKIISTLKGRRKLSDKNIPVTTKVAIVEGEMGGPEEDEEDSILRERRKVIRLARQLFSSSINDNATGVAIARTQLQSLCGESKTDPSPKQKSLSNRPDYKLHKFHSFFYLGLHYDALGKSFESKHCMKMALSSCPNGISGNSQDISYLLPVIHMTVRDWYDDDEFIEEADDFNFLCNNGGDNQNEPSDKLTGAESNQGLDALQQTKSVSNENKGTKNKTIGEKDVTISLLENIRESISNMKVVDLREELKKRNLKASGSKKVLQERLVGDIAKDARLS